MGGAGGGCSSSGGQHIPVAAGPVPRDALEGKGPQRGSQRRLGRRLEEVAKAVGGGYCRLQMLLRLALGVRGTVAGHRLGALEGGGGYLPPFQCIPARPPLGPRTPAGTAGTAGTEVHEAGPVPVDGPLALGVLRRGAEGGEGAHVRGKLVLVQHVELPRGARLQMEGVGQALGRRELHCLLPDPAHPRREQHVRHPELHPVLHMHHGLQRGLEVLQRRA